MISELNVIDQKLRAWVSFSDFRKRGGNTHRKSKDLKKITRSDLVISELNVIDQKLRAWVSFSDFGKRGGNTHRKSEDLKKITRSDSSYQRTLTVEVSSSYLQKYGFFFQGWSSRTNGPGRSILGIFERKQSLQVAFLSKKKDWRVTRPSSTLLPSQRHLITILK